MANCHSLFQGFREEIRIGKKKTAMIASKEALREKIRKWFKENHPEYVPYFFIQGSHKMKTGIRTKEDICDLDDGVYFFREPDVSATTLQKWVLEAVKGHTSTPPQHRKKCIRTIFVGDYEIDHPVYYKHDGKYYLAVKDNGFEESDPKEMVKWFDDRKDKEGRLVSNVKYLKAWGDFKREKMPSGLAMTILATNAKGKIVLNERDDITLKDILKEIKKALDLKFECVVPALPNDDLFADYDNDKKSNILTSLDNFIEDAEKALKEVNELTASKLWRKHLGSRFPEGEDKDTSSNSTSSIAAILSGASRSNPWCDGGNSII